MAQALAWGERLGPRIVDTLPMIRDAVRGGQQVLLEGQLGVMRDLDWGTYPYVTSSNPIAGGACAGAGLPPTAISRGDRRGEGLLHGGGRRAVPDRVDRRGRRTTARGGPGVRRDHRPPAALRLVRWRRHQQATGSTASPAWRSPSSMCWTACRS